MEADFSFLKHFITRGHLGNANLSSLKSEILQQRWLGEMTYEL